MTEALSGSAEDAGLLRHARHLLLADWGFEAQTSVEHSCALVVGLGGLGSAASLYLACCGVGRLILIDHDRVDLTNLHRQPIHDMSSLGLTKVESAARAIHARNPQVCVETFAERAQGERLDQWVQAADVVLDCSDNFSTRQAVNAACVRWQKPLVSGSAMGWNGQLAVFSPDGPCYACLFPPEPTPPEQACSVLGVFAPLVGMIGTMQAAEALRILGQKASPLASTLLMLEGKTMEWTPLKLKRRPSCPTCSQRG